MRPGSWICPACRSSRKVSRLQRHGDLLSRHSINGPENTPGGVRTSPRLSRRLSTFTESDSVGNARPFKEFLQSRRQRPYRIPSGLEKQQVSDRRSTSERDVINTVFSTDQLQSASPAVWTEALNQMDPRRTLPPYHKIHQSLNDNQMRGLGFDHDQRGKRLQASFEKHIRGRISAQISTTLSEYRSYLEYSARIGDHDLARKLWIRLREESLVADSDCYTFYMESIVWNEADRLAQKKKAVSPLHRDAEMPQWTAVTLFRPGSLATVETLLTEMRQQHVLPSTRTYCAYLTALAREGQLGTVVKILKDVWGVDVRMLAKGTQSSVRPRDGLERRLLPTNRLLVTLADIFGSYQQVATGLRVIDSLSKEHNLQIKSNIWNKLLFWGWTHARLAKDREESKRAMANLDATFELARSVDPAVASSWETLHVKFNNMLGLSLIGTGRLLEPLEAGRALHLRVVQKHRKTEKYLSSRLTTQHESIRSRTELRATYLKMQRLRSQKYMARMVRKLLRRGVPKNYEDAVEETEANRLYTWRTSRLPDLMLRYRAFVPSVVKYQVEGGKVELRFRTAEEILQNQSKIDTVGKRRRVRRLKIRNRLGHRLMG